MNTLQHIAFIMDGNRRYARSKQLPVFEGHAAGAQKAVDVIKWCLASNIPYLSLFALSRENRHRDSGELEALWSIVIRSFEEAKDFFTKHKIGAQFIGCRETWPPEIRKILESFEAKRSPDDHMTVIIALDYSGQWDIQQAVLKAENDIMNWPSYLQTASFPPPDLLIRTGKEKRISNYYLYSLAYTELFFLDRYWPELTDFELHQIKEDFMRRERRYGTNGLSLSQELRQEDRVPSSALS